MNQSHSTHSDLLQQADSPSSNSANIDMQVHEEFTKWAVDHGAIIDGVSPFRFPGKGLGLVANKNFEVQELQWIVIPLFEYSCAC